MCRSTSDASDDDGIVDDLQAGSSPTSTTAPPCRARPGEDAVPECVAGAVEAGRLAVPDADHAVVGGVGPALGELRPHDRRGAELLVDGGLVHDRQVGDDVGPHGRPPGRTRRAVSRGSPTGTPRCSARRPDRAAAARSGCERAPGCRSRTRCRRHGCTGRSASTDRWSAGRSECRSRSLLHEPIPSNPHHRRKRSCRSGSRGSSSCT